LVNGGAFGEPLEVSQMKVTMSVVPTALAMLCAAALLAACSSEPTFRGLGLKRPYSSFICYLEKGKSREDATVRIQFFERTARIESMGHIAIVDFERSFLFTDYYRRGDVEMRVDPEVYIYGMPGDGGRGPCQEE
jgi:hypothetical protein